MEYPENYYVEKSTDDSDIVDNEVINEIDIIIPVVFDDTNITDHAVLNYDKIEINNNDVQQNDIMLTEHDLSKTRLNNYEVAYQMGIMDSLTYYMNSITSSSDKNKEEIGSNNSNKVNSAQSRHYSDNMNIIGSSCDSSLSSNSKSTCPQMPRVYYTAVDARQKSKNAKTSTYKRDISKAATLAQRCIEEISGNAGSLTDFIVYKSSTVNGTQFWTWLPSFILVMIGCKIHGSYIPFAARFHSLDIARQVASEFMRRNMQSVCRYTDIPARKEFTIELQKISRNLQTSYFFSMVEFATRDLIVNSKPSYLFFCRNIEIDCNSNNNSCNSNYNSCNSNNSSCNSNNNSCNSNNDNNHRHEYNRTTYNGTNYSSHAPLRQYDNKYNQNQNDGSSMMNLNRPFGCETNSPTVIDNKMALKFQQGVDIQRFLINLISILTELTLHNSSSLIQTRLCYITYFDISNTVRFICFVISLIPNAQNVNIQQRGSSVRYINNTLHEKLILTQ